MREVMKRVRVCGRIREDLDKWIKEEVEKGTFRSQGHAVEYGLFKMREAMKKEKKE